LELAGCTRFAHAELTSPYPAPFSSLQSRPFSAVNGMSPNNREKSAALRHFYQVKAARHPICAGRYF
jgi:hypothetical protein